MGSFPGVAHSLVTSMSRRFEGDMAALDDGELGSTGGPEGNTLVAISVGWILSICADGRMRRLDGTWRVSRMLDRIEVTSTSG